MPEYWKKYWKQALFQQETLSCYVALYAIITIISAPIFMVVTKMSPNVIFGGITFFITTLIFLYIMNEEMKDIQERDEEDRYDYEEAIYLEKIEEQENFYDILSDIEVCIEEHTYDITESDEPLLHEVERLLQDIEYIEKKCDVIGSEAEEILLQIPKQVRVILQNYFEIFPEYRKELGLELLQTIQEHRDQLRTKHIQPYQDKLIQVCKTSAENLRGEKREYLYIQE